MKRNRSAASRKAWRTRKRMKHARLMEKVKALYEAETKIAYLAAEPWPDYMRRALPLPEFGK